MSNGGRREVSDIHPTNVQPVEAAKFITLEPNYEVTGLFIAEVLSQEGYESTAATRTAVRSLIEHIRYLTATDPPAVARILQRLEK